MSTKSGKKITFGNKPTLKSTLASNVDAWVESRRDDEPMKRLTIDIPLSLHTAIKTSCASRGTKIADEMREILLEKYGNN